MTAIPGATNATLTLNNLQLTNTGSYRLEAVNATNSGVFTYTRGRAARGRQRAGGGQRQGIVGTMPANADI